MRLIIALLFIFFLVHRLEACQCSGPSQVDSAFVYTPVVFQGKVVKAVEEALFLERRGSPVLYTFDIVQKMRGLDYKTNRITLFGYTNELCDYEFTVGEEYIVFAHYDGTGYLRTSSCSRTGMTNKFSKNDLNKLSHVVKRYNDEFDLTFNFWANERVTTNPLEKKEVRLLRIAYFDERQKSKTYLWIAIGMGIWSLICTGLLFFKRRNSS